MPKWLREGLEAFDELFGVDLTALWEGLRGGGEDQKSIWIVSTEGAVQSRMKRWEAELLVSRLRQDNDMVMLSKLLGDGRTEVVKTYRKDASMNDTDTVRIPINANYDQSKGPTGFVELPKRIAQDAALGGMILAPGGRAAPTGKITEVLMFGLIPSETFDPGKDATPIDVGGMVVGYVRLSEAMTFQYGALEDLELVPIVQDETNAVVGYRVLNRTLRAPAAFVDREPGSYIFRLGEDGRISGIEAIPSKHVLEVREDGYSLQHPYECRADGKSLHDCAMWQRVQAMKDDLEDLVQRSRPARYLVTWNEENERLELENVEHAGAVAAVEAEPQLQVPVVQWGVKMNEWTSHPGAIRPAADGKRETAEAACLGVGVLVRREGDGDWKEVDPNG